LRILINNHFEQAVILDMRRAVYARLQRLPVGYFDQRASGDLMTRVIEDVNSVERVLIDGMEQGSVAVLGVLGVAVILFWTNPLLAVVALVPIPILAAGALWYTLTAHRRYRHQREAASAMNALLMDNLQGMRQIKAFGREAHEDMRFGERAEAQPAPAAPMFARPTGFFAIGLKQQAPNAALVEKPWVDGVSLALGWSTVESNRDVYDFSVIGQTLAVLEPFGKKLVLAIFPFPVPSYLTNEPGVQTYVVPHSGPGFLTPVPWDEFGLARWEALFAQLANHLVPDGTQDGRLVPLRDHPLLDGLACWPMGMNGARDIAQQTGQGTPIYTLAGYSRATLAGAIIRSTHAVADRFPGRFRYLPFFRINDNVTSPTLDVYLLGAFKTEFFSGASPPQLGLFQENMSCTGPSTNGAFAMFQEKTNTYTMLQALQAWLAPQAGQSNATDGCMVMTVPGDRTTAISGPEAGIGRAFTNFNCRYFEIYKDDLLHPGFADEFQLWHNKLFGNAVKAPTPSVAGSDFVLQVPSEPGEFFDVQHRVAFATNTSWLTLQTNLPAAPTNTTFRHINGLISSASGFYRVWRRP